MDGLVQYEPLRDGFGGVGTALLPYLGPGRRAPAARPGPVCRVVTVPPGLADQSERSFTGVLNAILEVRAGRRPAAQLRPVLAPELFARLTRCPAAGAPRYALRSVRTCHPAAHVAEACGTARTPTTAVAVAARFERHQGRWRCTEFDLLEPGRARDGHRP